MSAQDTLLAMVKAAIPSVTVYDGIITDKEDSLPARYAVLYAPPGLAVAGDVGVTATGRHYDWSITFVAAAPDVHNAAELRWQVQWAQQRVRDYLTARKLTVGGQKIEHVHAELPGRDEQIPARVVLYASDKYRALT
ncbi:hypothetical protein ART_0177 [Arthrobacter sp. PAMC 25486]|uniref:hypothetical protein n=1 Tax=Arthrobacter sp. PAMC 25486 TaxID=1494608 RepID=UPI000535B1A8|nr:hypothetical protein [Arthrobacter sp. PAMC 25486]AIX99775.1 hypothetical protein ART_0177 [Arthrobacter sp. PAMC 25486]